MFHDQRPRLGQVPLILGPSSWRGGFLPPATVRSAPIKPPFYGEWGVVGAGGVVLDSGKVGPFDTIEEAFSAAGVAAAEHGATALPGNGWAQVVDSNGRAVGPVT